MRRPLHWVSDFGPIVRSFRPGTRRIHGNEGTGVSFERPPDRVRQRTSEWSGSAGRRRAQVSQQSPHAHGRVALNLFERVTEMTRTASNVFYVTALVAVIVGVDLLFFQHRFWERLMANIGIVLVFAAFYLRFLKHP